MKPSPNLPNTPAPGDRFGSRTVVCLSRNKYNQISVIVQCACGRVSEVNRWDLLNGKAGTCRPCADALPNKRRTLRSNEALQAEYVSWSAMRNRCNNPNTPSYPDYGGRGIRVCAEWDASFEAFFRDMGRRPSPRHSIDRIDNDGDYEPSNARWATDTEQVYNRRNTVRLEFGGRTLTAQEWATELGWSANLIRQRIKNGWSVERALTTPPGADKHLLTHNGKTQCIAEWARESGIPKGTIHARLRAGWTVARTLSRPLYPHCRRKRSHQPPPDTSGWSSSLRHR